LGKYHSSRDTLNEAGPCGPTPLTWGPSFGPLFFIGNNILHFNQTTPT